jgi:hypothetical protein
LIKEVLERIDRYYGASESARCRSCFGPDPLIAIIGSHLGAGHEEAAKSLGISLKTLQR